MTTALQRALSLPLPPFAYASLLNPDWVAKVMASHQFYDVPMQPLGSRDEEAAHMTNARMALRLGFQFEEIREALDKGFGIGMVVSFVVPDGLREGHSFAYPEHELEQAIDRAQAEHEPRDGKEIADAAADSVYFWIGFLLEMGYDLRAVMDEVHASNMTKPDENGQPIKRADGKVLKGPNFMEPNIPAALGWSD